MSMLIIVIAIIWFVADSIMCDNKTGKMQKKMKAQGGFLDTDYSRYMMDCQDFRRDWDGDRVNFPKEYQPYLEKNQDALATYIQGLSNQKAISRGKAPFCVGTYNRFDYNAFAGFHSRFDERIKILNETGVYYS